MKKAIHSLITLQWLSPAKFLTYSVSNLKYMAPYVLSNFPLGIFSSGSRQTSGQKNASTKKTLAEHYL